LWVKLANNDDCFPVHSHMHYGWWMKLPIIKLFKCYVEYDGRNHCLVYVCVWKWIGNPCCPHNGQKKARVCGKHMEETQNVNGRFWWWRTCVVLCVTHYYICEDVPSRKEARAKRGEYQQRASTIAQPCLRYVCYLFFIITYDEYECKTNELDVRRCNNCGNDDAETKVEQMCNYQQTKCESAFLHCNVTNDSVTLISIISFLPVPPWLRRRRAGEVWGDHRKTHTQTSTVSHEKRMRRNVALFFRRFLLQTLHVHCGVWSAAAAVSAAAEALRHHLCH